MFDLDDFVARCRAAARAPEPQAAVAAVLRETVRLPGRLAPALHRVEGADGRGVARLYADAHLSILHVDLAPGFRSRVHDHGVWAAIGVYEGHEENILYGRQGAVMREIDRVRVAPGEVFCMGARDIHHIESPPERRLRGLHCYGGDLRTTIRASYDLVTGAVTPEGGAASRERPVPPPER